MKGYTHPRRSPNLDGFAVKLDLWTALRALLGTLGEVFPERQHGMALDEVVPADAGRAGHLHGTCRLLPALLIRSTTWLSCPEHEPETLSILACAGDFDALGKLATRARRVEVQKVLVVQVKAKRGQKVLPTAVAGICSAAGFER